MIRFHFVQLRATKIDNPSSLFYYQSISDNLEQAAGQPELLINSLYDLLEVSGTTAPATHEEFAATEALFDGIATAHPESDRYGAYESARSSTDLCQGDPSEEAYPRIRVITDPDGEMPNAKGRRSITLHVEEKPSTESDTPRTRPPLLHVALSVGRVAMDLKIPRGQRPRPKQRRRERPSGFDLTMVHQGDKRMAFVLDGPIKDGEVKSSAQMVGLYPVSKALLSWVESQIGDPDTLVALS